MLPSELFRRVKACAAPAPTPNLGCATVTISAAIKLDGVTPADINNSNDVKQGIKEGVEEALGGGAEVVASTITAATPARRRRLLESGASVTFDLRKKSSLTPTLSFAR